MPFNSVHYTRNNIIIDNLRTSAASVRRKRKIQVASDRIGANDNNIVKCANIQRILGIFSMCDFSTHPFNISRSAVQILKFIDVFIEILNGTQPISSKRIYMCVQTVFTISNFINEIYINTVCRVSHHCELEQHIMPPPLQV